MEIMYRKFEITDIKRDEYVYYFIKNSNSLRDDKANRRPDRDTSNLEFATAEAAMLAIDEYWLPPEASVQCNTYNALKRLENMTEKIGEDFNICVKGTNSVIDINWDRWEHDKPYRNRLLLSDTDLGVALGHIDRTTLVLDDIVKWQEANQLKIAMEDIIAGRLVKRTALVEGLLALNEFDKKVKDEGKDPDWVIRYKKEHLFALRDMLTHCERNYSGQNVGHYHMIRDELRERKELANSLKPTHRMKIELNFNVPPNKKWTQDEVNDRVLEFVKGQIQDSQNYWNYELNTTDDGEGNAEITLCWHEVDTVKEL